MKTKTKSNIPERQTISLWPEAGKALGFAKNKAYQAAAAGQIPGAVRVGRSWIVLRAPFEKFLQGEA